ncbi:hypothetical protein JCM10207_008953 [Rhodosporidiobolus poonsookiae]
MLVDTHPSDALSSPTHPPPPLSPSSPSSRSSLNSLSDHDTSLSPSPTSTEGSHALVHTPKTLLDPTDPAPARGEGGKPDPLSSRSTATLSPPTPAGKGPTRAAGAQHTNGHLPSTPPASDDGAGTTSDDGVNPLFALSQRVSAGQVDPARVAVQRDGVVVREGSPGWLGLVEKAERLKDERREKQHGEAWKLFHGHGHHGHGNGADGQGDEATLRLDGGAETGRNEDGQPSQVVDFRDHPYEQDHVDALKMRMREARADLQDRLEDGGWISPSPGAGEANGANGSGQGTLEPRLAAMLERDPHEGETTDTGGASTYSTAASEQADTATMTTAGERSPALTATSLPPRTDSPLSYASLSEVPTPPPPLQQGASAPFVPLPHNPVATSAPQPVPSTSPSRSPARAARPLAAHVDLHHPHPRPAQPQAGPSHSSSFLHPLSASPSSTATSSTPPSMRRSNTTGSAGVLPGVSPAAAASSLSVASTSTASGTHLAASPTPTSRRYSSASNSNRLSVGPHPRSHSFSQAGAQPSIPLPYRPSSASFHPYGHPSPTAHPQAHLHPSASHPAPALNHGGVPVLDDVDASIAAQAEAIRRQRQEKRLEAEKEQQRSERQRSREGERDRTLGPGEAAGAGAGVGAGAGAGSSTAMPAGPGALLKRRPTRMGSGSSGTESAVRAGKQRERDASAEHPHPHPHGGDAATAAAATEGNSDDAAALVTPSHGQPSSSSPTSGAGQGLGPSTSTARKTRAAGQDAGDDPEHGGASVLVGNLIGQDHANYVLMYNMLTGIRIGVSRCQAKLKRPLTDADYTARHKFSFDIVGNELTPSVKYDFKFKDYAPWVFRELREYFYLDPSDYLVSLTAKYILSELGSPGKSGSFFYFSRDYRFIIKTIRHSEHKFLRSILKDYHAHVKANPHTLLSRFYGLHRVKLPHGRKIHFIVFNNLFPPHRDIHETYDLKGSSIGRLYPEQKAAQNPHAVLKDINWVSRHRVIALGPEKKALFEEQLRRDTEFLQKKGIMDYSLLTGIHNVSVGNEGLREDKLSVFQPDTVKVSRKPTQVKRDADASALRKAVQRSDPKALGGAHELPSHDASERRLFLFYQDEGGMRATGDGNEDLGVIYYLGIIDILTPYTMVKRLEHFFKGMRNDKRLISAIPPKQYGDRFLTFIRSCIRGNPETLRPPGFEPERLRAQIGAAVGGGEKGDKAQ